MKRFLPFIPLVTLACALLAADASDSGGLLTPADAKKFLAKDRSAVLLDVRTADEYHAGHIPGSQLLPYDEIDAESAAALIPEKGVPVVVYCRTGRRSAIAARTLRDLGYRRVYDLGGIVSWPYEIVK